MLLLSACYSLQVSSGGGQTDFNPPRSPDPADVLVPEGYRIELVASGLTFPTGIAFDQEGRPHVVESGYSYGEEWTEPRLLRLEPGGGVTVVAEGGRNGPWNGIAFAEGAFFVAEGGVLEGGRILRIKPDGSQQPLIENLPSLGDHHTNGPAIGPDGYIYFGQGTATNSGVVGLDNLRFGWLKRFPEFHDIPGGDLVLNGANYVTSDPNGTGTVTTGPYLPFGVPAVSGQRIPGGLPCTGAVMRLAPDGTGLSLVAWGLRNPFGLAFAPDGNLYITENGFDDRGSRPVWGTGDFLWRIEPGRWYGWPDYAGGVPLRDERFRPPGSSAPGSVLAEDPGPVPQPAAIFPVHSSSNGFDFSRNASFGQVGKAFVAQFGDMAPPVGKVLSPVGFKVVAVDVASGVIEDFAVNRGETTGPASLLGHGGLERPTAVRFDPAGEWLYVVDFGVMTLSRDGPQPRSGTGVVWRIGRNPSQEVPR